MAGQAQSALRQSHRFADSNFARDVLVGLSLRPKRLSPKYFYDAIGSRLFEEITGLPEYYPTRCELAILQHRAADLAALMPKDGALIEFGSGSTRKVRMLLRAASAIAVYVPVDISGDMLLQEAAALRRDFPRLVVVPLEADFTAPFRLPYAAAVRARIGFFPGSTIGNFEPSEAAAFLRHAAATLGSNARLVIGVDLVKDPDVLNAAYNDAAGVTARFNLNLLSRINRELAGDFDLGAFAHQAFYNRERRRIEMHLVSRRRQRARAAGRVFEFEAGETVHTENSYKYTPESFAALARSAGWTPLAGWTDAQAYFSVHVLKAGID